jgi:hypothetical protein
VIDRVSAGDLVLAYSVLGSYALERAKTDPDLGIVFPRDYTLLLSRVVRIPQSARQPLLAGRFVDSLLSRDGQETADPAFAGLRPRRYEAIHSLVRGVRGERGYAAHSIEHRPFDLSGPVKAESLPEGLEERPQRTIDRARNVTGR